MAVTPGFLGIDEPAVIDKRADTNVVTRAATVVHREVVSLGSADDATPESLAKIDSTGSLRTVSTDAAGTNQQAITAAGDAKVTLDGEQVDVSDRAARDNGKVDIASLDQYTPISGRLPVDGSGVTQPISAATLPLPTGAATSALQTQPGVDIGDVTINNGAAGAAVNIQDGGNSITVDDGGGSITIDGTVTAVASGTQDVQGNTAHATSDSGNPVKIGGKARNANPSAVANNDRVDGFFDDLGKQVVRPYVPRDLITHNTITLTSTTETTLLAQVASTFLDLIQIVAINTSATAVRVDIRDSTTGTIRFALYLPAGDTRGVVFQIPIPQAATNTNWTAQLSAAVTDVRIFALAVRDV